MSDDEDAVPAGAGGCETYEGVADLIAARFGGARVEWTAMTDYRRGGVWGACGTQGDRQHAESEMDDWAKEVGDEHVRLASRVVTEWRPVGQSDRRQDHHGVTGN